MLELGNVLNATYSANVALGVYTSASSAPDSAEPTLALDDESVSVIRYVLQGQEAERQTKEEYAEEAISKSEEIAALVASIEQKMAMMREVADRVAAGGYSPEELSEKQLEFEQLAEEVNSLAANTEYNGNRLFGGEGSAISISIGNGSTIEIAANDLSVDIEGLDLTADPEAASSAIQSKLSEVTSYKEYTAGIVERLEGVKQLIEYERYNDLGVKPEEIDIAFARQIAELASVNAVEALSGLFDLQANVEPVRAFELLKEKVDQASRVEG